VTYYIGFNVRRPPFNDRRVRQAFAMALDRGTLANVAMKGTWLPGTGGFLPPGIPGHSPGMGLPYDPEGARELLAAAGHARGRGLPTLEVPLWAGSPESAKAFTHSQWRENLGIDLRWIELDFHDLIQRIMLERPSMFIGAWQADYLDADNFLRIAVSFPPFAATGWRDATFGALVESANRTPDHSHRIGLFQQADGVLVEKAAIIPFAYVQQHYLVKPWVTRFSVHGATTQSWGDIVLQPH
jgi:oligopeptide transport system substrate-binding protein